MNEKPLWDYCALCGRRIELGETSYETRQMIPGATWDVDYAGLSFCMDCCQPYDTAKAGGEQT